MLGYSSLIRKLALPAIQIAIDTTKADKAVSIASLSKDLDHIIVEAGTPLIKKEGIKIVSILKAASGGNPLLADLKTMDAADIEVGMVYENKGDIATILAVADNDTIKKALEAGRKYNVLIQADLIASPNPLERGIELAEMGVPIIGLHTGIDVQKKSGKRADALLELLKELKNSIGNKTLLSIAGGIKPVEVPRFLKAEADIIVIGSAITGASNPKTQLELALSFII